MIKEFIIGNYLVKRDGNVINIKTNKTLKQELTNRGYLRVTLSLNGKTKRYLTHRLLAIIYLKNPYNKNSINHKNGIKTDNRVDNIEWCTLSENMIHAYNELKVGYHISNERRKKPVILYKNNIEYKFDYMALAGKYLLNELDREINRNNIKNMVSAIGAVCKNKRETCYGYRCRYMKGEINVK